MQKRHTDREQYFAELAQTAERHLIPYIQQFCSLKEQTAVLELGCGDGGNLLPFAKIGCKVMGIDLSPERIADAQRFFEKSLAEKSSVQQNRPEARFLVADVTRPIEELSGERFDLILCHDVIEHIPDKQALLRQISTLLNPCGLALIAFPAWQMPFGGHQQICHSRLLSHLPWIHLLPASCYRRLLRLFHEDEPCIRELLSIHRTRLSIEQFERLAASSPLKIRHRQLWLVNPHYEIKFHLRPRRLSSIISRLSYLRNFLTTSCFYLLELDSLSYPPSGAISFVCRL